jgi:hypothetical protein
LGESKPVIYHLPQARALSVERTVERFEIEHKKIEFKAIHTSLSNNNNMAAVYHPKQHAIGLAALAITTTTLSSSLSSVVVVNAVAVQQLEDDEVMKQQFNDKGGTPIITTKTTTITRHLRHPLREAGAVDEQQQQQQQSRELNHQPRKKTRGVGVQNPNRKSRNVDTSSSSLSLSSSSSSFRLRLHWERGYYWQESTDEMYYCMECNDNCNSGNSILIDWCSSNINAHQYFTTIDNTIRPVQDTSLCLTAMGNTEDNPIRVYRCMDGNVDQQWDGFQSNGRPFELHPRRDTNRCVGQLHHPKRQERVYPEECRLERNDKTSLWITF